MNDFARRRWLPAHASTPDAPATAQTLTSSYVILGSQFQVAAAGQLSIKFRHTATAGSQQLKAVVYESDDDILIDDGDSVWHPVGGQANASGALTEQSYEYTGNASAGAGTTGLVALVMPLVAKKAKIMVKSAANAGSVIASVSFLPIV